MSLLLQAYTHCASFTSSLFKLKSSLWKCTEWVLISEQSRDAAVVNWLIESLPASWQIVVELCAGWNWYCRDSFIGNQQAREAYIGRSKEEDLSCGLKGNNIQKCLFQLPLCCLSSSLKYYSENKEFLSCFSHHKLVLHWENFLPCPFGSCKEYLILSCHWRRIHDWSNYGGRILLYPFSEHFPWQYSMPIFCPTFVYILLPWPEPVFLISVVGQGLVTKSRFETLQEFKKPYAHEHEPCGNLVSAIKVHALRSTAHSLHPSSPFMKFMGLFFSGAGFCLSLKSCSKSKNPPTVHQIQIVHYC